MRPELPDGYAVEYRYVAVMSKRPPRGGTERVETLRTLALVRPMNAMPADHLGAEVIGEATLNPGDPLSLPVGKAIALGRALKALVPRNRAEERVLALARERFGAVRLERKDGRRRPFIFIYGDVSDDAEWEGLIDFYERLDQLGLRSAANVVLTTLSK